ncbi:MAG: hypothetical protein WKF76_10290 [Nocardioidaceae bacterium]
MTVIGEIRDAVAMLSDGVQQIRTLVEALNDGRTYLQSKHPDAQPDLARLLRQMNVTITRTHQCSGDHHKHRLYAGRPGPRDCPS